MIVSLIPQQVTNINGLGTKVITEGGLYQAVNDNLQGYSSISVQIPTYTMGQISVTKNGTYNAETYGFSGFDTVEVNVPENSIEYNITQNINANVRSDFNFPVIIDPALNNYSFMFSHFLNFNKPVIMSNNVTNCAGMFTNCWKFNQPITITENVQFCQNMFNNCQVFNQSVTMSANVIDCQNMFMNCTFFNQPITIPDNVQDCNRMFSGCVSFRQSITIPNSMPDCFRMLQSSNIPDVYIYKLSNNEQLNMAFRETNTYLLNIHINSSYFQMLKDTPCIAASGRKTLSLDSSKFDSLYNIQVILM